MHPVAADDDIDQQLRRRDHTRGTTVVVITASIGAGHDGPAREIARQLRSQGHRAVVVDLVTLAPAGAGRVLRRLFRWHLTVAPRRWGSWYDAADDHGSRPPLLDTVIAAVGRRLAGVLADEQADLIVSTFPFGGPVVAASRRHGPAVPLVTYVTDPAAHGLWAHPVTSRYLVTAASTAADIWRHGAASVTVVAPAVGPRVRPLTGPDERRSLRVSLGLPAGRLALVSSGSWAVGDITGTARDLRGVGLIPVVACGRNIRLLHRLEREPGVIALQWTDRMPELIRACDVVLLNSGGLTLMEAVASRTPVLHYRPLPGQGRANAAAGERSGIAAWPRTSAELADAIHCAVQRTQPNGRPTPHATTTTTTTTTILDAILGCCPDHDHAATGALVAG